MRSTRNRGDRLTSGSLRRYDSLDGHASGDMLIHVQNPHVDMPHRWYGMRLTTYIGLQANGDRHYSNSNGKKHAGQWHPIWGKGIHAFRSQGKEWEAHRRKQTVLLWIGYPSVLNHGNWKSLKNWGLNEKKQGIYTFWILLVIQHHV